MTWGYDADPVRLWSMVGGNNVRNHAKNMASDISDRRRDCRNRPVIFITHSLGGLVCAQALLICKEGDRKLERLVQATRGIIFMGTPHAGGNLAQVGHRLAALLNIVRRSNPALLEPLRRDSSILTTIQQQFQQFLLKPEVKIEVYCFFEERDVVGIGIIVPEHSATLSQYPNQSIAANHMDMTKFSSKNDQGYQRVLSRVQDIIETMESSSPSM
jgi:pimeloyl-ACP methyl ester carboxylesterase